MINPTNPTPAFIAFAIFFCAFSFAQKKNVDYKIHLYQTDETFTIDGIGDEATWQKAEAAQGLLYGFAHGRPQGHTTIRG